MRTRRLLLLTGTMLPGLLLAAPAFARGDGVSGTILLAQGGPDERGPRGGGEGPGGRPSGREGGGGAPPAARERPEPRPERAPAQERPQQQERPQPRPERAAPPERPAPQERAAPPAARERPEPREERAPAPRPQEKAQPAPSDTIERPTPPTARERAPERAAPPPTRRETPEPAGKPPASEAPPTRTPPAARPAPEPGKAAPTPPATPDQPAARERPAPNAAPGVPGRPVERPGARPGQDAPQERAAPPGPAPGGAPGAAPGQPGAVAPNARPGVPGRPVQRPDAVEPPGAAGGPGRPVPSDTVEPQGAGRPGQPGSSGQPGVPDGAPNAAPGVPGRPVQPPGAGQRGPGRPDLGQPGAQPGQPGDDPRGLPAGRVEDRGRGGFNQPGRPGYVPGGFSADDEDVRDYARVRRDRREFNEDGRTYIREPGRIIVRDRDNYFIRHDENERFRDLGRGGYRSERRGPDTYTYLDRPGGEQIVTVVDDDGRMLRRYRRFRDGREVMLIDNGYAGAPRPVYDDVIDLPPPDIRIPRDRYVVDYGASDERAVYEALSAPPVVAIDRRYTLDQVRYSPQLRARMRSVDIDTITFDTASFTVTPDQAARLSTIAAAINQAIRANPQEVFLIEGYTDAVGADVDNLSLSDRRAQSVATVLTQNFQVPPENLTTQGYGEQYLKVNTQNASRENRRVTVRRITPLLQQGGAAPAAPR